jgi:small-conductance mechanosensitive channel
MATNYLFALTSVGTAIVVSLILYFGTKNLLSKSKLSGAVKIIMLRMIGGPVIAAIVAYGLLLAAANATSVLASLPTYLKLPELQLIAELLVLAIFIRALGSVVSKEIPNLIKAKEADKILVYSVYTAGLLILAYLVLTSSISPTIQTSMWSLINFLTGVFMTYLAVYIINVVFRRYSAVIESKDAGLRTTLTFLRRLLLTIVALVGVATATFASFPSLGVAIASLFVAAGFASIVIGLAAQTSLANLIAGMVISTSQPFRVGDALSYANEWAWVEDIKLTFTVLRTWDNRRLVVPNQMFLSSTMINYDLKDSSKLCVVYVSITYDSDLDKAIQVLKDVTRKHPDFLPAGNLPVVHVMDLGDANSSFGDANASPGILLRVLGNAKDQPTNFQMSKDILYQAKKEFDASGIKLALPMRQIVMDQKPRDSAATGKNID